MAEHSGHSQQISDNRVEFIKSAEVTEVPNNPVRQLVSH